MKKIKKLLSYLVSRNDGSKCEELFDIAGADEIISSATVLPGSYCLVPENTMEDVTSQGFSKLNRSVIAVCSKHGCAIQYVDVKGDEIAAYNASKEYVLSLIKSCNSVQNINPWDPNSVLQHRALGDLRHYAVMAHHSVDKVVVVLLNRASELWLDEDECPENNILSALISPREQSL